MLDPGFLKQLRLIVTDDGLRTSDAQRHAYASDAYTLEKAPPGAIVLPSSTEQVAAIVKLCRSHGVPIVPRGAGTGLAGGAMARENMVLLCLSRMNRILKVDIPNRRVHAEAGVVNTTLTKAVAPHGFLYAPDPSSQGASTVGGNLANNAGGPHTLKYGVTANHILGATIVLPSGDIVTLDASQPGLDILGIICGSEGTIAIVTEVVVKIVRAPEAIRTLLAVCPSVAVATKIISSIIAAGIIPAALEMIDQTILRVVEESYHLGLPTDAGAVLLIEMDGPEAGLDRLTTKVEQLCIDGGVVRVEVASDAATRAKLWTARKKAVGALGRLAPSHATQDGVVPRTKLPEILEKIEEIAAKYNLRIANVFHAGDGNLHPVVLFDERDKDEVKRVLAAGGDILRACVDAGGTLTGEHGIGLEKQEFMGMVFTPEDLELQKRIRDVFNPNGLLNPGKLFPVHNTCCPHMDRPDNAELQLLARGKGSV